MVVDWREERVQGADDGEAEQETVFGSVVAIESYSSMSEHRNPDLMETKDQKRKRKPPTFQHYPEARGESWYMLI